MKYKKNKDLENIEAAINEWENSGLSQKEACDKYGINKGCFEYHLYRRGRTNSIRQIKETDDDKKMVIVQKQRTPIKSNVPKKKRGDIDYTTQMGQAALQYKRQLEEQGQLEEKEQSKKQVQIKLRKEPTIVDPTLLFDKNGRVKRRAEQERI